MASEAPIYGIFLWFHGEFNVCFRSNQRPAHCNTREASVFNVQSSCGEKDMVGEALMGVA